MMAVRHNVVVIIVVHDDDDDDDDDDDNTLVLPTVPITYPDARLGHRERTGHDD